MKDFMLYISAVIGAGILGLCAAAGVIYGWFLFLLQYL